MNARVGFIRNPFSERNRRTAAPALPARVLAHAVLDDFADLGKVLEDFRRARIDLIIVDGGDGTVQGILTELAATPVAAEWRPRLAVLASGMTNLIAADVGHKRRDEAALNRFLADLDGGRATVLPRRTLRLDVMDSRNARIERRLSGMFFGAAALRQGTEFARAEIHTRGIKHASGVAFTIAVIAWQSLRRRQDRLFLGDEIELSVDGGPPDRRRRFLFMATTLERLVLGLWPFWGEGDGPVRYLDVPGPPPRLLRSLLRVLSRRPSASMARAGYRSGRAETIALDLQAPYLLDGELLRPAPHQRIVLSAGPSLEFVRA